MGNELKIFTGEIDRFSGISLEDMDNVRLMNRTDTKFIFPTWQLPGILAGASQDYRVLSIGRERLFRYNSLYFDTPDLRSYFDHHNGRRPRYKVRFREYENSGTVFLEVKRKVASDRTRKSRIQSEGIEQVLSGGSKDYIAGMSPYDPDELAPAISTIFERITLVGKENPERITIDVNLKFRKADQEEALPFLTIAEVKRDQSRGLTPFMQILRENRIYPGSSSKYCLGIILLKSPIKHNRFKPTLLKLNKIKNAVRTSVPAN